MDIIGTVRRHVGRRYKITRQEMADLLGALHREGLDLRNDCMTATHDTGAPYGAEGYPQSPHAARAWANACTDITCISVLADRCIPHGQVRYDQPGGMAPMQHAVLMFVPEELGDHEYDQIWQMRRKADRLLVVSGDELRDPPAPVQVPSWILRLRKHPRVDGTWVRIHDNGMLEMRNPNDGQSSDQKNKSRYQYRVTKEGDIEKRHLPPESVGDAWRDIGIPEWEDAWHDIGIPEWECAETPPRDDLIYMWWEEQVL